MEPTKILIVEDATEMCDYLTELVRLMGFDAQAMPEKTRFVEALHSYAPDLVLAGVGNHHGHIRAIAEVMEREKRGTPMLCIANNSHGVRADGLGAGTCLASLRKDFNASELKHAIDDLLEQAEYATCGDLDDTIIGRTPALVQVKRHIVRVSKSDVTVLIMGESGTGKELVARAIHKLSPRAQKPFIKVNSAALPAGLLESELFGFEQGAFTGAIRKKPGKFELAHSGTILLDEIGEIPLPMQAKLLQVLQDSEFSALGSVTNTRIDARVVAATNANLGEMVSDGTFRSDLYYRLNVVAIHIPPLRERKEDIDLLCQHFLEKYAARYERECTPLDPRVRAYTREYDWPGNIRELENFVQSMTILGQQKAFQEKIGSDGWGLRVPDGQFSFSKDHGTGLGVLEAFRNRSLKDACREAVRDAESEAIAGVLLHTHWNRRKAASLLQVSYKALLNKIKEYEIEKRYHDLVGKNT